MRFREFLMAALLIACLVSDVYAKKLRLKDGRVVEGEVVEQSAEFTTLRVDGYPITYYSDQIAEYDPIEKVAEPPPSVPVDQGTQISPACQLWLDEAEETQEAVALFQEQRYRDAHHLLQPLLKEDNLRAAVYLWDLYKHGKDVIRNPSKADQWLQEAIDSDLHRTLFWLSEKDAPVDPKTLEQMIRTACDNRIKAEQGDPAALRSVVLLLAEYDRASSKSSPEILAWYRKAAELNDAYAQFKLGDYLATGPKETRNMTEGIAWLWKAHDQGDKEALERLIQAYRDEVMSNDGSTYLKENLDFAQRVAASKGDKETLAHFVAAAFEGNDQEVLNYLFENGLDANAKTGSGAPLLMAAVGRNDLESVRYLLAHKADPNAMDQTGSYPLLLLANAPGGDLEIAKVLLEHGAKPDGVTIEGNRKTISNPLAAACVNQRRDLMELLVEKGANVNFQGDDGHTLLMWATSMGAYEIVAFLMEKGADPTLMNKAGVSAIGYADTSPTPDPRIKQLLGQGTR